MLCSIHVSAPAKLNIGLSVLPVRGDGFHDIKSIFTEVSLCDELDVSLRDRNDKSNILCSVNCSSMSLPEKNTITMTYKAFCELTGFSEKVHVELEKHIPSGGGLGGGSSDAASFLFALEALSGIKLSLKDEESIASKVGSDVFFFLHCGRGHTGCAVVTGRGELVEEFTPRADVYYLLLCPPVQSSTKEAYALVDLWYQQGKYSSWNIPTKEELKAMYNSPFSKWTFRNHFTPALEEKYPVIGQALADLKASGAVYAEMSGSGSSLFGVFSSEKARQQACEKLCHKWNCYV
ncbi:MAG: 4-(cytidine 5'-diphospho)-2-C-methyl-D-erythritol kinase [Treponema sp.]|nr:4-(cytidine 5'-diphospho)-2-C-methyl-D-erythritol kinase [Treponema sp.]